jgi:hypothetical protein
VTHLVVVQDDALPCASFEARLAAAIEQEPDALLPLFVPGNGVFRRTVHMARQAGQDWARIYSPPMVPTVALVWPVASAAAFLTVMDEKVANASPRQPLIGDDGWTGRWALKTKARVMVPLPCLVQHPDIEPSLIGRKNQAGRNVARVAAWFTGD